MRQDEIENYKPTISILMPVKNTSKYLSECIESIIAQTYQNWELIAVDDHSEDNSKEILQGYADQDFRICMLSNEGRGIIEALMTAFQQSNGKYITRMDSDDIMMPEKLITMRNQLEEKGSGYVAIGLVEYFSGEKLGAGYRAYESWLNGLSRKGRNFEEIYKECVIPSPCWMVSREDFVKCGGFGSNIYPEDYDLCFRFYKEGLKVIPAMKVLHSWRDYSNRTSRIDSHYSDNSFLDLKVSYFLDITLNARKDLILWGAGKKGKKIAQILLKEGIDFSWISNNRKKVGLEIYGKTIIDEEESEIESIKQYIIAVANKEEQEEIRNRLEGMVEYYMFC